MAEEVKEVKEVKEKKKKELSIAQATICSRCCAKQRKTA